MAELEQRVCEIANSLLVGKTHIKLLEAGCGSASHIQFNAEVHAVGIDISSEELEKNTSVHEKIVGDIQEYSLPENEFDVVICWMVLEHLSRPKEALLNLTQTVRPQGLLILGFPNLLSVKGIITKFTPFCFHEQFYKFMKYKSRHFPTFLRADILPQKVVQFAEDNGFSVELCQLVEGGVAKRVRSRFRVVDWAFYGIDAVTRVLSFGEMRSPLLDNCGMVLRKRTQHA
jgi:2-polyprenyl-3-methyl-5-hydroxy-6-metoxy-1,4-benzoquinol methylase